MPHRTFRLIERDPAGARPSDGAEMRVVRFFTRSRTRTAADPGSAGSDGEPVRTAEAIVRRAWLRDLQELRRLTEVQLQTAVAEGVEAYENLRRAQGRSDFQDVVAAQVAFDAATRLALAKSRTRERLNTFAESEFRPSLPADEPKAVVWRTARIVMTVRRLLSKGRRRMI